MNTCGARTKGGGIPAAASPVKMDAASYMEGGQQVPRRTKVVGAVQKLT